jgi:DNA-binding response OmpR family regulator
MTKILIFDLDPRFAATMKEAVDLLGYEGVISPDAYSLPAFGDQHKPALFVLDYKIPGADGFELLTRLRKMPAFAATPIVFASSTPKFEIEMALMGAEGIGFVDKPLDPRQLKDAIEALIGKPAGAPAAAAAEAGIPAPGEPLGELDAPSAGFTGEPDLDGARSDVMDLD